MTPISRTISLLWALRSYCASHQCRPCYFTWLDEQRVDKTPGILSHFSPHDLPAKEVMAFARTLKGSAVRRVFLAGGKPLMWRPILDLPPHRNPQARRARSRGVHRAVRERTAHRDGEGCDGLHLPGQLSYKSLPFGVRDL